MKTLHTANGVKLIEVKLNTDRAYTVLAPGMVLGEQFRTYGEAIDRFDTLVHGN